nr:leucine-rich repeat domain-containing protein [Lachnospiraceae bacterium]
MRKENRSKATQRWRRMQLSLLASLIITLFYTVHVKAADPEEKTVEKNGFTYVRIANEDASEFYKITSFDATKYNGNQNSYGVPKDALEILSEFDTSDYVEEIGEKAFENCTFSTVMIRPSTKVISKRAFYNSANLVNVSIPYTVKEIEEEAFASCNKLKVVLIPESVESIGYHALGYDNYDHMIQDFKIIGIPGSAAQKYAEGNGFVFEQQYSFEEEGDGTLCVTGSAGYVSDLILPSEVDGKKVSSIASSAFAKNQGLLSVVLPQYCKKIGDRAFESVPCLSVAYLPYGLEEIGEKAFYNCKKILNGFSIPCTVTSIGDYALGFIDDNGNPVRNEYNRLWIIRGTAADQYATKNGFDTVDTFVYEFNSEGNYYKITRNRGNAWFDGIPETINGIPVKVVDCYSDASLARSMTIPKSVTMIERLYSRNLESIYLPDGVTLVGDSIRSTALKEIALPKGTTIIGKRELYPEIIYEGPFVGCPNLKKIVLEKGYTGLPVAAFAGTHSLEEIVIPDTVTSIDMLAVANCPSLKRLYIPDSVTNIGRFAYGYKVFGPSGHEGSLSEYTEEEWLNDSKWQTKYEEIAIVGKEGTAAHQYAKDNGITFLGEWDTSDLPDGTVKLCKYNGNAVDLFVPETYDGKKVTQIGDEALKDNTRIESVTISYDVTSIGAGAFSGCTALKDIQFSGALQQIGNRAFE